MHIRRTGTVYGLTGLGFTAIYLILFRTPLFASQHVLFYRGLELLVVSAIVSILIGISIYRYIARFSIESFVAALIMSVSLNLAVFIVFPVTFDRSVTMYMLSKVKSPHFVPPSGTTRGKQNSKVCEGATVKSLETSFIDEYVLKSDAISRRVYEQSIINTIKDEGGCISLTQRGQSFLILSEQIKQLYNIKNSSSQLPTTNY